MPAKIEKHIVPLNMNRLEGRMLDYRSKKKNPLEILFVYGQRSSIERWWGLIQLLHDFGHVTVPDMPGFGGMSSFYSINKKPSLDNYADYLASFIKMKYKRRKIVVVGLSYGFAAVTRMLEKYPDLNKNVTLLVSIAGFADCEDFNFKPLSYKVNLYLTWLFSRRSMAWLFRHTALSGDVLRKVYGKTPNGKAKFAALKDADELSRLMDFEVTLWQQNDARTYMYTSNELLRFSNCEGKVALGVHHVAVQADNILDNSRVEQHMRVIFSDFYPYYVKLKSHAPTMISDRKTASMFLPKQLKQQMASLK
jgi:pimeloyl-ACP methyl ester carboxylesterase